MIGLLGGFYKVKFKNLGNLPNFGEWGKLLNTQKAGLPREALAGGVFFWFYG